MGAAAYLIHCAAGPAVRLDRAAATQYAAEHHGTLQALDPADSERLDWLNSGGLPRLVNALLGDWDSDVLCVGGLPDEPGRASDVRALIDQLRACG